ncbi:TetR family transcriptional regulator C-terminal domain-containing protein [Cohaesibacter gelatinilyticus]|uniref:TetR family transcriptional regulator C-terminal domain-containing protein n=1 Tax=Cohaesibacter gelatinilyticus TaxID=372072 RepID=UPI00148374B9|nr:TetR family transcriptional regulator C-terminal domain-containing protein [Cohaesibacter gelatinilyticus]
MPPKAKQTPKYSRLEAEVRRERLILATIESVGEVGYSATTVREICRRAEVSPGLLRFHFSGKAELILHAYERLLNDFIAGIIEIVRHEDSEPRVRLAAFVEACFDPSGHSENRLAMMLAFWSELRQNPNIRGPAAEMFSSYRSELIEVIKEVALIEGNADEVDASLVAISLTSLVDGLWLERSVNPEGFSLEDARLACYGLLDGFLFCGTNEQWLQERAAGRNI